MKQIRQQQKITINISIILQTKKMTDLKLVYPMKCKQHRNMIWIHDVGYIFTINMHHINTASHKNPG